MSVNSTSGAFQCTNDDPLVVLDGANGLRAAECEAYGDVRAARTLAEGLEEALPRHRLGGVAELGTSLAATNLIESVISRVEATIRRVDR